MATVKNEIMPFAATRMELEMIILSEVRQRQILQIPYGITYIWINNMMEINFFMKQKQTLRHRRQTRVCLRKRRWGGRIN